MEILGDRGYFRNQRLRVPDSLCNRIVRRVVDVHVYYIGKNHEDTDNTGVTRNCP